MSLLKERLRSLRLDAGKTQVELSQFLNIKHSSYNRYETGVNRPDYETLSRLADFYGVSVDYILGREQSAYNVQLSRMINLFESANDQAKESAIFILERGQTEQTQAEPTQHDVHDEE